MVGISKIIRIFAVVRADCHHGQSAATKTLRIKKETLSSFLDTDKTAKTYQNLRRTEEQAFVPSYQGADFLPYCWRFGCLAVPIKSQKQKVSVPFFPYKLKYYIKPMTERI